MRRWFGLVASLLIAAGLIASGGSGAAAASPGTVRPATCTGTVKIISLAFSPTTVARGGLSTATLKARNCTGQTLSISTTWYGRFIGSTPGIPAGCPAVDPLGRPATFTPYGTISLSTSYLVFAGCTATSFQLTVQLYGSAGLLTTGTATLLISP